MFDTIIFPKPITCKVCGKQHKSVQTKSFENFLKTYKVGDILSGPTITGIMEETMYCDHEAYEGQNKPSWEKVLIVIWNHILLDVVDNYEAAEYKISHFGIGDLYLLYQVMHKSKDDYRGKGLTVIRWCERYAEFLEKTPQEQEEIKKDTGQLIFFPFSRIIPYLEEKSPLGKFLEDIEKQKDFKYDLFL